MNIKIETRDVPLSPDSATELKSRVIKRIGRLAHRITHLNITLADVNGDKGGEDKLCKISAQLTRGRHVIVTQKGRTGARALFRGLRRFRRVLSNHTRRTRSARPPRFALEAG